jgi:hypothetical protein
MHHLGDDLPDLHLELYIQPASRDMVKFPKGCGHSTVLQESEWYGDHSRSLQYDRARSETPEV